MVLWGMLWSAAATVLPFVLVLWRLYYSAYVGIVEQAVDDCWGEGTTWGSQLGQH